MNVQLVHLAIDQIRDDMDSGDYTAVEELLKKLSNDVLYSFLGEDRQEIADSYESQYDGQPDEAQEWHDFDPEC